MTREEEIKQFALQSGAEIVGVASVAEINKLAPPGHRPDDILVGAQSVIAFAGRDSWRGAWHSPNFQTHYYNRDFSRIRGGIGTGLAKLIESKYGYYTLADLPGSVGFYPALSQKLCAELAGLGTRSMAGSIILNRDLGLLIIHATVTTMPLKADGRMKEAVCPHPDCMQMWEERHTTPCLATCPECLSGEIEDGRVKWMRFDRRVCSTRAQNMGYIALQRTMQRAVDEPDPGLRRSILFGSFGRSVIETLSSGNVVGQCAECLRECPVCIRARSLKIKRVDANV